MSLRLLILLFLCPSLCWASASRSFDGTEDRIDMGNNIDVTTGNVSACAWVKLTEDAGGDGLIGKDASAAGSTAGYYLRQNNSDNASYQISDGVETAGATSTTTDLDGAWRWVCGTWDATAETATVYVGGVSEASATTANVDSLTNAKAFRIGADGNDGDDLTGGVAYGLVWSGKILTVVEIIETQWKPGMIADNLSGFWTIWGDATEVDLSGNGLGGTPLNTTTSTDGPPVMFGGGLPL